MSNYTGKFIFNLPNEIRNKLEILAVEKDMSKGALIRRALIEYLEENYEKN